MEEPSISIDDLLQVVKEAFEKQPKLKESFEANQRYMNLISPYLSMTKEEMEAVVPDGTYNLSGGGLCVITGKGGFIASVLAMQKEIRKLKGE